MIPFSWRSHCNWAEYGSIPVLKPLPHYTITAMHSRSEEKAPAVAARHGIPFATSSLETLVAHPEGDLVKASKSSGQRGVLD